MSAKAPLRRILVVDDNPQIHEDFKKVLCRAHAVSQVDQLETELFGTTAEQEDAVFVIDSAFQGEDALHLVRESLIQGRPYSLAFVDMRMPPGWDGFRTVSELHKADPSLPMVTCTAYSDYTADEMVERIGLHEGYLYIRKPFEPGDVRQIADRMSHRLNGVQ